MYPMFHILLKLTVCGFCLFSFILFNKRATATVVHVFCNQVYSHLCIKLSYCIRYNFSQLGILVTLYESLMHFSEGYY